MDRGRIPLIVGLFVLVLSRANAESKEVRDALVRFMEALSTGNSQKDANWGWNTTSDPCIDRWRGVNCSKTSQTVKKIVLDEMNLTGRLDARSLCVAKSLFVLSLNSNNLVGTLPKEISNCTNLTHIYLRGNKMWGNLPASISRLGNLKRLYVSDNAFSGDIPSDISRISGLITFSAENNKLTGSIPEFDFAILEELNVSNNNLIGPIPDGARRYGETSFLGNSGLCGEPLPNPCPPSPPPPPEKKGLSKKDYLIYSGYAAIGLIIVVSLVFFILFKKGKNKVIAEKGFHTDNKNEKTSSVSTESKSGGENRSEFSITSAESGKGSSSLVVLASPMVNGLKFEDLLRSPAELIGRGRHGSLYKVSLNENLNLAVKRIRDWDISRDDFEKRIQQIHQVKHPNVMPIVAYYCSKQEKLLVYEFQEKGSLFTLLHGSQNGQSLDWGNRLNFASKISEALAYMHEGLQADGIGHGNLKSSNILLDKDMEPLINEYGLSEEESQDQSFLAQIDSFRENNSPSENNAFKNDIYSFGVILLELLTGKLVQNNGFELARWVNSAIREEWTVEVFDKALVSEGANEERMVNLLQVALKCINTSSEARPSMREVSVMINSIKEYEEKSINSDP